MARVGGIDGANLQEGEEVLIALDAVADKRLHGHIKTMSGTASSNPMSFDPAKRFDVVFSIEMRELLGALGAKPESIQKILATAEANKKKPAAAGQDPMMAQMLQMMAARGGGPNGAPGAAMVVMAPPGGGGGGATAQAGRGPAPQMSAEDQKNMRDMAQKMTQKMTAAGGPGGPMAKPFALGPQQFTPTDLENAKLPPPPGTTTQLDVLLP